MKPGIHKGRIKDFGKHDHSKRWTKVEIPIIQQEEWWSFFLKRTYSHGKLFKDVGFVGDFQRNTKTTKWLAVIIFHNIQMFIRLVSLLTLGSGATFRLWVCFIAMCNTQTFCCTVLMYVWGQELFVIFTSRVWILAYTDAQPQNHLLHTLMQNLIQNQSSVLLSCQASQRHRYRFYC